MADLAGIELENEDRSIRVDVAPEVRVDVQELRQVLQRVSAEDRITRNDAELLIRVLDDCDAPFLGGAVDEWALGERERFRNLKLRGLTILMHWYAEQRRYEDAIETGRTLLLTDPFREAVQRELMWLYVLSGQRVQALKQYLTYATQLKTVLEIEPMAETRALFDHIRKDLDWQRPLSAGDSQAATSKHRRRAGAVSEVTIESRCPLSSLLGAIEQSRRALYRTLRTHSLA